jgi:ligand-binding sensor domain-containing protein
MKPVRILTISLIFLFSFNITCFSQGNWKVFTKDEGLSSNNITNIFKDSKGNLWFNPSVDKSKGITKFDGKDWIKYYNTISLAFVTAFFEDSNGNVLLGSYLKGAAISNINGLTKINGNSFDKISKGGAKFIIEGSDGKIWYGAKKLYSYDGNNVIEYSKKDLGGKKITALHCDKTGNIWAGTKTGVAVYNGITWKSFFKTKNTPTDLVTSIISDSQGNIWIGAEEGVFKYDGSNWQHFTTKDGLLGNATLMVRIDSRNTIFAIAGFPEKENIGLIGIGSAIKSGSANKGLSVFEDGHWMAFTDIEGVPKDLMSKSLLFLPSTYIEDKSGNLWFNSTGNTIYKFDGSTWESFNESNGFTGKRFGKILEDSKGNYWFSIAGGIAKYDGKNWSYFNKDTGLPSNIISSIIEDNQGNIWFGTFRGVVKYTPE